MLQRTALFNMGHFEDQEGKIHFNLGEAKEAIDVIKAIQSKTKGNLTDRESKILSGIVSELQMRFVHAPARQRKIEDELAQEKQIRQSFESPLKRHLKNCKFLFQLCVCLMRSAHFGVYTMSLVNEIDSEDAPVVLIVDNNQMSVYRLREIFKTKDFKIEVCEDGDLAVDEYIRLDPELVVLALDIPSLDGHLAALEMREHGGESELFSPLQDDYLI